MEFAEVVRKRRMVRTYDADRPPRTLDSGDVIDIGAHRLRYIATPHVPHAWDAGVYHDEATGSLPCVVTCLLR